MTVRTSAGTFPGFPPQTAEFLRAIRAHNNKAWFQRHRAEYDRWYVAPAKAFVTAAGARLRAFVPGIVAEPRILGSIFRINRDVRFTRTKRPYKDYIDFWFWEGERRTAVSGFFLRISPDVVSIGVGCHEFGKERIDAFRRAVVSPEHGAELVRIAHQVEYDGYEIEGARYVRIPRGYDPVAPAARFLLHSALFVHHNEMPDIATEGYLLDACVLHWQALAPLHRWMHAAVRNDKI